MFHIDISTPSRNRFYTAVDDMTAESDRRYVPSTHLFIQETQLLFSLFNRFARLFSSELNYILNQLSKDCNNARR